MRWKFAIPLVIILSVIVVFDIIFLDTMLKKGVITAGEIAFGAKVEISSVKTRIKNLSININGLAVADKDDQWKNLFEAESIKFSLSPIPLLSKKVIINEMSVEGVKLGTKRDTSGALPPKTIAKIEKIKKIKKKAEAKTGKQEEGFTSKMMGKIRDKSTSEIKALPALDKIKAAQDEIKNISVKKVVNIADLKAISEINTMKDDLSAKYSKYKEQLSSLEADKKIKEAASVINDIKNTKINSIDDINALNKKVEGLNKTKEGLERELETVKSLKSEMSKDWNMQKDLVKKINELKDNDYRNITEKLKLPDVSFGNIAEPLFGPVWLSRVSGIMKYITLARKYMPPKKKEEKKVVKTRLKGMDVSFPKEETPPDFLVKKVMLSGIAGSSKETSISFSGSVSDITSDQLLVGKPTRSLINGSKAAKKLQINGIFDHRTIEPTDTLNIKFEGLTLQELGIPSSEYLPAMEDGQVVIENEFTLKGDYIDCNLKLNINNIKLASAGSSKQKDAKEKFINKLWEGISDISVKAGLSGSIDSLSMSITSNLDRVLSKRLKELIGGKLAELQDKIKKEIDRLTLAKKKELLAELESKKKDIKGQYTSKEKESKEAAEPAEPAETKEESK